MLKRNNATTMMLSGVVGSFVVLSADVLARTIYSAELPISILTTVIGVPLLVYFMITAKKDRI
jgi:iron complex transport system permease protein